MIKRDSLSQVLSGPDAAVFLAELTGCLTIGARNAYLQVDEVDVAKLRAANETLHAVSSKLIGVTRGIERFPSEAFLKSIRERAGSVFGEELEWALGESLRAIGSKPK